MAVDALGWPILDDAARAKRRKWLGRAGVLWGQWNWIGSPPNPLRPPRRLPQKEDREAPIESQAAPDPNACCYCGKHADPGDMNAWPDERGFWVHLACELSSGHQEPEPPAKDDDEPPTIIEPD